MKTFNLSNRKQAKWWGAREMDKRLLSIVAGALLGVIGFTIFIVDGKLLGALIGLMATVHSLAHAR